MGKAAGIICIVLGILCLIASLGFVAYNRWDAQQAEQSSQDMLKQLQEQLVQLEKTGEEVVITGEPGTKMIVQVDGYDCIGVLSIPVLELELPVLANWDYDKLRKAPCQYYGSVEEGNFVISAHNYPAHFGRLSELLPGDLVIFTDLSGKAHYYEVALLETLPPEAIEQMVESGFPLSLYTCTPGGGSRVTVRCQTLQE